MKTKLNARKPGKRAAIARTARSTAKARRSKIAARQRPGRRSPVVEHESIKRPPLERMKRIYSQVQDGQYPNCSKIAAEFEVDRKTAQRDIDFMRTRMGLPLEYDDIRHGYFFTEPVDRFPGVPVTEKELFALCVAHKAIEQYHGTALQQALELAFQKLAGQLDHRERFTLQGLDEVLSFRPFAPEDADLELFELVSQAISERRGLEFRYRKPGDKTARVRRVHPYHLMEFGARWYLLAHDLERGDIRKFVLGRMREPALTGARFVRPRDFEPNKHFDRSLGVMTGPGDYEVVVELDSWLTDVLRGRRWHRTQVWTELPGGASQLRLRLSCLEEIEQYILSWGTHVNVLGPAELRERVGKTAEEVGRRYARGGGKQ